MANFFAQYVEQSQELCVKKFTKIFTKFFSRMLQSQNFERRRNMDIFLPKQHPFLVFSSSNESQDRVLQD